MSLSKLARAWYVVSAVTKLGLAMLNLITTYLIMKAKIRVWTVFSKYRFRATLKRHGLPEDLIRELVSIYDSRVCKEVVKLSINDLVSNLRLPKTRKASRHYMNTYEEEH